MGLDELRLTCIKGSKMPKNQRRGEEIDALIQFTADVPIFNKEIVPGNEEHKQICMHLTHLKVSAEETIYSQGEMGDKFYVVINGSVSVYMTNEELEIPGDPILQEILTTGGSFGEECLVDSNDPRRNTVITRTNCDLLVLDREDYEKATHYKVQEELKKKLLVVDQIYPFQTLSAVSLKTLALVMTRKRYKYNDVIFQENSPANAMYFVVKGQVRIVKAIIDKDVRQVEPVFLELCIDGPLTYFGEMGFLTGKRFASALCASPDCELLELVRYDFMKKVSHELLCMLREQAKFYPTYDEIMTRYKEIKKWNEYKTAVVDEAEKDLKRKHKSANSSSFSTSPIRTNNSKKQPYFPITVNIKK